MGALQLFCSIPVSGETGSLTGVILIIRRKVQVLEIFLTRRAPNQGCTLISSTRTALLAAII